MKKLLYLYKFDFLVILLFIMFISGSYFFSYTPGVNIFEKGFWPFFREMLLILPLILILIGLFDVWIPREKVEKHIGRESGLKGVLLVMLLAFLNAGPLYAAFPVAYILWKKGCSPRNIFIYLGSFSSMKLPMLAFEMSFLGITFSLLRIAFTIPVFLIIAFLMDKILQGKDFTIKEPE